MKKNKVWVEISKSALIHNLKQFRKLIGPNKKLAAIVKSNAYGHGLIEIAKIAENSKADWLGVDSVDEAITLKKNKLKSPILILGYTIYSRLSDIVNHSFRQTVYSKEIIKKLGQISNRKKKKTYLHLKLETGTSRQGVLEKDLIKLIKLIKQYKYLNLEGISTHFANIEDTTDHTYARKQLADFKRLVEKAEKKFNQKIPIKHAACSAATILFPQTHFNLVRAGISIYGLWSSGKTHVSAKDRKINFTLKPVLTWKTIIAQVKKLKAGAPIGYGLTEILTQDSKIAILPIGYWDGYDRSLSSIGNVLIQGKRCRILGRVCMNMIIVDVSHITNIKPEDEVVLIGQQGQEKITADEIAGKINTINYEVVARINPLLYKIIK